MRQVEVTKAGTKIVSHKPDPHTIPGCQVDEQDNGELCGDPTVAYIKIIKLWVCARHEKDFD